MLRYYLPHMSFRHFDALVRANEFWTMPTERISQNLERNHKKDAQKRAGISAVVGCPLPEEVLKNIQSLQRVVDERFRSRGNTQIAWRSQLDALHFSVHGLVMPDDYRANSWPLHEEQLTQITDALRASKGFALQLQGIGILGMGAISVRVSDSPELEKLRDTISSIEGISKERFGSRTKKIVIGRIQPPITVQDKEDIKVVCDELCDFLVGTLRVDSLEIIHYKNTFLETVLDRVHIS